MIRFVNPFQLIGQRIIGFVQTLGQMGIFLVTALRCMFTPPILFTRFVNQIYFIGVKTIIVIVLTGFFTGMVLTLQSYYVLIRFGAESGTGSITALSLIREIGPVLAALMVVGRAGSALTAEIGIMRISEQIDALDAMALNPYRYLVVPNLLAGIVAMPVLTSLFVLSGVYGGYWVIINFTGLSIGDYFGSMADNIILTDLLLCLYKSITFGLLILWICTFKGFMAGSGSNTGYGALGVSRSTTDAVVISSVVVLICDYFITSLMIL